MISKIDDETTDRGIANKDEAIEVLKKGLELYFNADDVQIRIQDFVMEEKSELSNVAAEHIMNRFMRKE